MKNQKGYTLVELIVTMAITGVIITFLGTAVYQILTVTDYGNSQSTALHELQNSAYWFKYDGINAETASGGSQLVFTRADNTTITYYLSGTELRRDYGGSYMVLARYISDASFEVNDRLTNMSLTSLPPARDAISVNGTYTVYLKVGE